VVVMGGHIDSWDVGQGALDDGAGIVIAMEALNVIRKSGMIPRRTIRVVCWTNEENGLAGAKEYARTHAAELSNHVAAIESDSGCAAPRGFSVQCKDKKRESVAASQLTEIIRMLNPIGTLKSDKGHSGADVSPMSDGGVVLMGFEVEGSTYFDYHHTQADTLDKIDRKELSKCVAAMAAMAFTIADMPERMGESGR
jgi:carboxypeptidase Q